MRMKTVTEFEIVAIAVKIMVFEHNLLIDYIGDFIYFGVFI